MKRQEGKNQNKIGAGGKMKDYFNVAEKSGGKRTGRKNIEYRHLSNKDKIKLQKQKNIFKKLRKVICFGSLASLIILIFGAGIITFYTVIDGKNDINAQENNKYFNQDKNSLELEGEEDDEKDKEVESFFNNNNSKNSIIDSKGSGEEGEKDGNESGNMKEDNKKENSAVKSSEVRGMKDFSEWNKRCPKELIIVNGKKQSFA